ncbi:MAG: 7-cyano-7-deazaguanine synthase QueC [Chloroflexota bacterium]
MEIQPEERPRRLGALSIFSGGLDSTTATAIARSEGFAVQAIFFAYGQKHEREVEAARAVAEREGFHLRELRLPSIEGSALTDGPELPRDRDLAAIDEAVAPTYVPNRNMIMIAHAAAIAYAAGIDHLFGGWNVLDASNYPDCRDEFLQAMEVALERGTGRSIIIHRPLIALTKAHIIRRGLELGAPLELTWSCYAGGARPCCRCDTCLLRTRGFLEAGVPDPALTSAEWREAACAYRETRVEHGEPRI